MVNEPHWSLMSHRMTCVVPALYRTVTECMLVMYLISDMSDPASWWHRSCSLHTSEQMAVTDNLAMWLVAKCFLGHLGFYNQPASL